MSTSLGRKLVDRYYAGAGEGNLARILGVLHSAVEYPAPTVGSRVASSSPTAITSTVDTSITGATVTFAPEVDMSLHVIGHFNVSCTGFGAATHTFSGALYVNGVAQAGRADTSAAAADDNRTVSNSWIVALKSGTSYTLNLRGKTSNVGTTWSAISVNTAFTYLQVPNLFVVP